MQTVWQDNCVLVISLPSAAGTPRAQQRRQARAALIEAASHFLQLPASALQVESAPGSAPRLRVAPLATPGKLLHCSFSHDDGLSLAALNLHGPVGVDLMRIAAWPDWEAVARDYLGPAACADLLALPAAQQAPAFARAWTALEARLKCAGQALSEWQPGSAPLPGRQQMLALPMPFVATLVSNSAH